MTNPRIIVVDLDGTLCNSAHREHLARAGQWDEFHSLLGADKVWEDVAGILRIVADDYVLVALTGRNAKYQFPTLKWLKDNDLEHLFDFLLMRPNDDYRSDTEVKPALLGQWLEEQGATHADISFILEDRDKMVETWRELGHNCFQVRPGGY
jgi:FMN phosphatase YigB (HAD superfamily)